MAGEVGAQAGATRQKFESQQMSSGPTVPQVRGRSFDANLGGRDISRDAAPGQLTAMPFSAANIREKHPHAENDKSATALFEIHPSRNNH
jgi:hypothetical protein